MPKIEKDLGNRVCNEGTNQERMQKSKQNVARNCARKYVGKK